MPVHNTTKGFRSPGDTVLTRKTHYVIGQESPHFSGIFYPWEEITATSTTAAGGYFFGVTNTSSAYTLTLASRMLKRGRVLVVKDQSGGANSNNITIATEGSETIDGSGTASITSNYGATRLYSDGTNWFTW